MMNHFDNETFTANIRDCGTYTAVTTILSQFLEWDEIEPIPVF